MLYNPAFAAILQ